MNRYRFKRNFLALALAKTKDRKARTFGSTLIENWSRLWTFLRVENLQPTNNIADRALRPLVILKRIFQRLPSQKGPGFLRAGILRWSHGANQKCPSI